MLVFFLIKLQARRTATLIKKTLQHRCFPLKYAKFLITPFFTEQLRWLLLKRFQVSSVLSFLWRYFLSFDTDSQIFENKFGKEDVVVHFVLDSIILFS